MSFDSVTNWLGIISMVTGGAAIAIFLVSKLIGAKKKKSLD